MLGLLPKLHNVSFEPQTASNGRDLIEVDVNDFVNFTWDKAVPLSSQFVHISECLPISRTSNESPGQMGKLAENGQFEVNKKTFKVLAGERLYRGQIFYAGKLFKCAAIKNSLKSL